MFLKDVVAIKPGSFIKGMRFLDDFVSDMWKGRRVTLHLNDWNIPKKLKNKDYVIRTPWFNKPTFKVYNSIELYELLVEEKYKKLENINDSIGWDHVEWSSFKINEPVGIHLGVYGLVGDAISNSVLFYTKILRNDGQVGFISLSTKNIEENELELL